MYTLCIGSKLVFIPPYLRERARGLVTLAGLSRLYSTTDKALRASYVWPLDMFIRYIYERLGDKHSVIFKIFVSRVLSYDMWSMVVASIRNICLVHGTPTSRAYFAR